jgi:hypothetical protein
MAARRGSNKVWLDSSRGGRGANAQGDRLVTLAMRFFRALKLSNVELSLSLVDDAEIRQLNALWRRKNVPTVRMNVLADKISVNRIRALREPGLHFVPAIAERMVRVSLQVTTIDIPARELITSDSVTVQVNGARYAGGSFEAS